MKAELGKKQLEKYQPTEQFIFQVSVKQKASCVQLAVVMGFTQKLYSHKKKVSLMVDLGKKIAKTG